MNWKELIEEYCRITEFDRADTLDRLLDYLIINHKITTEDMADFLFPDNDEGYFS